MSIRPIPLFVCLTVLLAGSILGAQAQITITAEDVKDLLVPGVYGQQTMTPEPGETAKIQDILDRIGDGGVYDFSSVQVTSSFSEGEIQERPFEASVPTDSDFDDADFVDVSDPFGGSPTYSFFRIEDASGGDPDGQYEYGDVSSFAGITQKTTYSPPLRVFPLPLMDGIIMWESGDVTESTFTNNSLQSTQDVSYSGGVIGHGTLVLPGGQPLPTLVHRMVQTEGSETTVSISFVTKGQRDAATVLTDGSGTVLEIPTGTGTSAPAAFLFLRSEAAVEEQVAQNTEGAFLGGDLGASVELTTGSSTAGQLRGYRINFPSFNNAIDDSGMPAGFPVENVSQDGYWVLEAQSLDATYRVCLNYGGTGGIVEASELSVLTRGSDAEPWRPLGSTVDTGSQQVCADGLTTFSQFAVGGSGTNPLPVELAGFDVAWSDEGTLLTWQTASETNNSGFHVERKEDSGEWRTLDFVEGRGTTESAQSYRFADAQVPFAVDTLFYRLRQVDRNGTESFSEEISVALGVPERLSLHAPFPNPARGTATLRYAVPTATDVEITVYNVLGQRVVTLVDGETPSGRAEHQLNVSRWPSGAYFVRMVANGQVRSERLTVVQ